MEYNKSVSTAGSEPASGEPGTRQQRGSEIGSGYALPTGDRSDAGRQWADQSRWQDEPRWVLGWVEKKRKEGWDIYSCYEAGASGYWLHRHLVALGVKNQVIAPKATGQRVASVSARF
jgi:hypothetical protein